MLVEGSRQRVEQLLASGNFSEEALAAAMGLDKVPLPNEHQQKSWLSADICMLQRDRVNGLNEAALLLEIKTEDLIEIVKGRLGDVSKQMLKNHLETLLRHWRDSTPTWITEACDRSLASLTTD